MRSNACLAVIRFRRFGFYAEESSIPESHIRFERFRIGGGNRNAMKIKLQRVEFMPKHQRHALRRRGVWRGCPPLRLWLWFENQDAARGQPTGCCAIRSKAQVSIRPSATGNKTANLTD